MYYKYGSNWEEALPAVLYAWHHTVHAAMISIAMIHRKAALSVLRLVLTVAHFASSPQITGCQDCLLDMRANK